MRKSRYGVLLLLALLPVLWGVPAHAQQRDPHIGYIYPAGGQQGRTIDVIIGGQHMRGVTHVYVSGTGVQAEVLEFVQPLSQKEKNDIRQKMQAVQQKRNQQRKNGEDPGGQTLDECPADMRNLDVASLDLQGLAKLREMLYDPKKQPNAQLAETVVARIRFAPSAEPGRRELRLQTAVGLSNPMCFHVGPLPEYREKEPNDRAPGTVLVEALPAVLNGQIMPGDVDRFRFKARKGRQLVIATRARALIPYLADAVPGWFQATVTLYDSAGKEIAFADDYRFDPDPVLLYEVPADGEYELEIRDSIYRGREDFVYRMTVGSLPFVTSIFPLGGRRGECTQVTARGWNLPDTHLTLATEEGCIGRHTARMRRGKQISNPVAYAVDDLPEFLEKEPNSTHEEAQSIACGIIMNGRISTPDDRDVFRFEGRAGEERVAEVYARRLNSPLDSVLTLTDAKGKELASNDDHVDKGAGLTTHHADSYVRATLPEDGVYYVHLGDAQHKGGEAYAYRLRISPPRPNFELRIVPSAINLRPGATVPLTAYALRKDGFDGDLSLAVTGGPEGCTLSGAWIPGDREKVRFTLSAPAKLGDGVTRLVLEGRGMCNGREITRTAVPAEDMMQAFLYRHLVPAEELVVNSVKAKWRRPPTIRVGEGPVKLPVGGTVRVAFRTGGKRRPDDIKVELSEPPEGVSIQTAVPIEGGMEIVLKTDADKSAPGLRDNLIIEAFREFTPKDKNGKPRGGKKRTPFDTLPAVPFEIVKR